MKPLSEIHACQSFKVTCKSQALAFWWQVPRKLVLNCFILLFMHSYGSLYVFFEIWPGIVVVPNLLMLLWSMFRQRNPDMRVSCPQVNSNATKRIPNMHSRSNKLENIKIYFGTKLIARLASSFIEKPLEKQVICPEKHGGRANCFLWFPNYFCQIYFTKNILGASTAILKSRE